MLKTRFNIILIIVVCSISFACSEKRELLGEGRIKSVQYVGEGALSSPVTILTFENGQTITIKHYYLGIPDTINTWQLFRNDSFLKSLHDVNYEWIIVDKEKDGNMKRWTN